MNKNIFMLVALLLLLIGMNIGQIVGNVSYAQSRYFDKDLIEKSEAIVVARVTSTQSYWGKDSLIWTRYTFSTKERLKGTMAGSFSMETQGGEVGKIFMRNSTSHMFDENKSYLLFIKKFEHGKYGIVDTRGSMRLYKNNAKSRYRIQELKSQIQILSKEKKNVNK